MAARIPIRGAHEHNLQHVDLDFPLGLWTSVVGPSGSGKTSLVVDTIVREGQQRFLGGSPRRRGSSTENLAGRPWRGSPA